MLTLPIKKKWFEMIKSGKKKEEYREIKPYYDKRFNFEEFPELNMKTIQHSCWIRFRNGYSKSSPTIECSVVITKDYGKPEWGAEPNKLYYVLKILGAGKPRFQLYKLQEILGEKENRGE